jgi:hypothetical protein
VIEDTAEIHLGHPNPVQFEAGPPQNGLPRVAIRDLLRAALQAITGCKKYREIGPHNPIRENLL